jgi:hypothetical protein
MPIPRGKQAFSHVAMLHGLTVAVLHRCNWASARRHMRSSKTQEFFFATDPTPIPYTGPQATGGSILKVPEKPKIKSIEMTGLAMQTGKSWSSYRRRSTVPGAVTGQQTNTTTTTTRPMTHDEKHALKEEREHQKKAAKEEIERRKDALDKAKDKLDDDEN